MTRLSKLWWMVVLVIACACSVFTFLFVTRIAGPRVMTATSSDGRFTTRIRIGERIPIEIVDNHLAASVPLHATEELNALLNRASGVRFIDWREDNITCSVLVTTGNTRKDRIVWMNVSPDPPKAEVTALQAVDD